MKTIQSNYLFIFLLLIGSLSMVTCTNLDEEILDEQLGAELVTDPGNTKGLVNPAYASLRFLTEPWRYWGLQQATTDETIFPTRGTDWYDGGIWQQNHLHTWTPFHDHVVQTWNRILQGISRANTGIFYLRTFPETQEINDLVFELRFLRAYYVYVVIDLWGQVPFRDFEEQDFSVVPEVMNRTDGINWLITELTEIIPNLKLRSQVPYGRASKGAAQTMLAKIYLNHEVYTGEAKWAEALAQCNAVINSGEYEVTDDYWTMFEYDNGNHPESIFVVVKNEDFNMGSGHVWVNFALHYNQTFGNYTSLWNGASTTPTFLNTWDTKDDRYFDDRIISETGFNQGFLIGQQYNLNGDPLETRTQGEPLIFTPEVSLTSAGEAEGVRVIKYAPNPNTTDQFNSGNDYQIYRISDVYLMRAEAQFRIDGGGLDDVNLIRSKRNVPPLNSLSLQAILQERGFELYWEGHRRTDMIRFGTFTDAYWEKPATDVTKLILPIPQSALDVNPNLEQNPGY